MYGPGDGPEWQAYLAGIYRDAHALGTNVADVPARIVAIRARLDAIRAAGAVENDLEPLELEAQGLRCALQTLGAL